MIWAACGGPGPHCICTRQRAANNCKICQQPGLREIRCGNAARAALNNNVCQQLFNGLSHGIPHNLAWDQTPDISKQRASERSMQSSGTRLRRTLPAGRNADRVRPLGRRRGQAGGKAQWAPPAAPSPRPSPSTEGNGNAAISTIRGVQKQGRGAKRDQSEECIKKGDLVASQESSMQRSPN